MANTSVTNTVYVPTIGYVDNDDYAFRITASLTGNTKGNTREVQVTFSAYAQNSGGYYDHGSPTATIYVNSVEKASSSVPDIWGRNTWHTMVSWKGYVQAGQNAIFKGKYYSAATNAYMPDVGSDNIVEVSVLLTLDPLASIINDDSISFNVEDKFSLTTTKGDSSYTDILKISLTSESNSVLIKTVNNYTSGSQIFFTSDELAEIYSLFDLGATVPFTFQITTMYNGATIGTSETKSGTGKITGNAHVNVNGSWKKGITWVNIGGTWKRAVINTNSSGTWKRGI